MLSFMGRRGFGSVARAGANPRVFLEVSAGENTLGRMSIELFSDKVPQTAENFRSLCAGDNDKQLSYKGTPFTRIFEGFCAQGGDVCKKNGTGNTSIYGERFPDEDLQSRHNQAGLLTMHNTGPNSNGSQFYITFGEASWLDGYHTVFGKVVEGFEVMSALNEAGHSRDGTPTVDYVISDCGLE